MIDSMCSLLLVTHSGFEHLKILS